MSLFPGEHSRLTEVLPGILLRAGIHCAGEMFLCVLLIKILIIAF